MSPLLAILGWIVFGLIVGALGRLLVPGPQPLGWLGTIGLGVAGSFAGGFLAYLIRGGEPFQPSGFLMSLLGAVIVLAVYLAVARRRTVR